MNETKSEEQREEEYTIVLFKSEERIRAFFLRLLHESIKLYNDIAPKIKERDKYYGKTDLWKFIMMISDLSSCRDSMMGSEYYFDHK